MGSLNFGSLPKTWARVFGPFLAAQPDVVAICVRRILFSAISSPPAHFSAGFCKTLPFSVFLVKPSLSNCSRSAIATFLEQFR